MKSKIIYANYNPETGKSIVKIQNQYGIFTGVSQLQEEDRPYESSFAGCEYAEMKANISYMKHRKKTRKISNMTRFIICAMLLGMTCFLTWSGIQDLKTTAEIRLSIQQNKKKTQELEEEKSDLEETKQKLTNPDYIEYIARGKYLVTKEGEQVFKFPSSEDEESEE